MEDQQVILQQFRQQQEKLIYYIIALCVAAIGFAVVKTTGQPLKFNQIPLAAAILCWGLSIYYGLRFLKLVISSLYANNEYINIIKGVNPEIGRNPQMIQAASSGIIEAIQTNSEDASKSAKYQERLFYAGVVLFIIWHITEMYTITVITK